MKVKSVVMSIIISGLIIGVITSPYSLNFAFKPVKEISKAQTVKSNTEKSITFVSNESSTNSNLNKITKEKNDKSLEKIRDHIKNGNLKVKKQALSEVNSNQVESNSETLAFNVNEVRKSQGLQNALQNALKNGDYVYLYGNNFKPSEFKKLAKLDEIKVPISVSGKNGYAIMGDTSVEGEKEKGKKKEINSEIESGDDTSSIIGYSNDPNIPNQYSEISINSYDDKGNKRENDEEVYIQEILNQQAEIVDDTQQNESSTTSSLLKKNSISAATAVQDKYGFVGAAYDRFNNFVGRIDTDYTLYKADSDSSKTLDYFTLKPKTQITEGYGNSDKLFTDIDIPYDGDHIEDWDPHGSTTSSYDVQFSYPWSVSWTGTFSDEVKIEDLSSRAYDYARWNVTDGDLNHQDFRPGGSWSSSGTYAVAGITARGFFSTTGSEHGEHLVAEKKITVKYDY
ncbi:hypothetical protein ABES25_22575 [Bacillus gobiensis]|uniref:hypothetical protein n=1 Tax=Bacillus gobiensis TaxID=1441095 RepID=UPI003D24CB62